ncbi:ribosomal protein S18-alanine N-acetyltransferase [Candidatus Poriferisocius sp.]|uniref:ribosomal protein S18-alanine N-acetyltransferase n=1 Tax=Candidatus Poriferisocius sp. TaxID=3101276 RepID=UPI003B5A60D2
MTSATPVAPAAFSSVPGTTARAVTVQPMTASMLPEVMAIDAACYPVPWSRAAYESELARADDRLYLVARHASEDRRIVGHGGMAFDQDEAHVTTMTVAPVLQGRGIGARLFLALALAARRRSTSLALEVATDNPVAQALYRRFGLAPVGIHRGYYADMGLSPDAVVMRADNIHHPDYANRLVNIAVELDCT